ncbi:CBS domain-containing protein [Streptomyces erythrochromogenes]|uniref:CBS domain-containing protein n=1 Tax=Streptomyces erythrochromogenes TaxID=285574 RepID=A0ABZ1QK20_9ACTN|nr:CBS domain-containing protein [Streptomyces erythrochromogenes]MCX5588589.1 CBS domain-containing protein [Streptomyces erythrochromogenes]
MKHLRSVEDVMTHAVISVDQGTAFKDIVEALRMWNVSALPVLAQDGQVVGVVSEADLLLKPKASDTAHDTTAEQLMTRPAVTVTQSATIPAAARLMARGHLKRLPVVDRDSRLVGVVSRGDLLKVFLRPDEDIGAEIRELIMYQLIPHGSAEVHVHVANGIVYLNGSLPDPAMEDVVVRAAGTVPGVVDVKTDFTVPVSA